MIHVNLAERKAHPPLGAGSEVSHGVEVVVTGKHVNRTAPSGWMVRLVLHLDSAAGIEENAESQRRSASPEAYRGSY